MTSTYKGLELLNDTVQLGFAGNQVRSVTGAVEIRNPANDAYQRLRAANPQGGNDVVNLNYLLGTSDFRVTGEIDGTQSALPSAATNNGEFFVVSATGTINSVTYTLGQIYRSDGTNWVLQTVAENQSMKTDATYGPYIANREYNWDGTMWILDVNALTGVHLAAGTVQFDSGTSTIIGSVPSGSHLLFAFIKNTTVYNGVGASITLGITGDNDAVAVAADISTLYANVDQVVDLFYNVTAATNITATVNRGTTMATAGVSTVHILYSLP